MTRLLSEAEVRRYHETGYLAPIPVMPPEEAIGLRRRLEAFERREGGPLKGAHRHKAHLLFPWLAELVRHPRILDAVEDVLGGDILVWTTNFFTKEAMTEDFVSWHQDSTYWGLSATDVATAWIAFTPSTVESGAMRVIPGSHKQDQLPHRDRHDPLNLLTRGQEVQVEVDEREAVDLLLQPGEMSLHHIRIVHGSSPNRSADRRIGFAIRYIPPSIRQIAGRDSASLVRGIDRYGHFEPEPTPRDECGPETQAAHAAVIKRHTALLMAGSAKSELK
ncbi:MAG: phytanoyl-CoA dioxygenase family protein [Proteobacteria bacterium]|nr:phytanoyl-CoA dioxygenase family protein [Pseudomonadota bacterium]MBI3498242.1 phytanoyl-CoA dioxygenase family protein [Pseudomonadota bacterium]